MRPVGLVTRLYTLLLLLFTYYKIWSNKGTAFLETRTFLHLDATTALETAHTCMHALTYVSTYTLKCTHTLSYTVKML